MIEYKDIKDSILPDKEKCCQKCSHWKPDETDITKRIFSSGAYKEWYGNTGLFDDNVWTGRCDNSGSFSIDLCNDQEYVSNNMSSFKKGMKVYFGTGYEENPLHLTTFNTFCCADIGQDLFEESLLSE